MSVGRGPGLLVGLCLGLFATMGGCRYERVVEVRTPFDGLPGAVTPGVDGSAGSSSGGNSSGGGSSGGVAGGATPAREVLEDGTVVLRSRNPRELMRHVLTTLSSEEREVFLEQVLSESTRSAFLERGFEPAEAYERLRARLPAIRALLTRIPQGELSPDADFRPIGRNAFRLRAEGRARRGLSWTSMDVVIENGSWRLVWFGTG